MGARPVWLPVSLDELAGPRNESDHAIREHRTVPHVAVPVDGDVQVLRRPRPASAAVSVLAELRSPPLEELLPEILTRSHNWYADTLVLTLGLEVAETGRFDDGVEVVADFVMDLSGGGAPEPPAR